MIEVARGHLDTETIFHQRFAGNCIEAPSERCFTNGLGNMALDCSGLIVRSICEVNDWDAHDISRINDWRHVRNMWQLGQDGSQLFEPSELAVGALVVTRRHYIPAGHIGIITAITPDIRFIHASANLGIVEERPLRSRSAVLGYLAVIP